MPNDARKHQRDEGEDAHDDSPAFIREIPRPSEIRSEGTLVVPYELELRNEVVPADAIPQPHAPFVIENGRTYDARELIEAGVLLELDGIEEHSASGVRVRPSTLRPNAPLEAGTGPWNAVWPHPDRRRAG